MEQVEHVEGIEHELNAPRRDSVLLWTSVLTGPSMWSIGLLVKYLMVHWACESGHQSALLIPAIVTFIGAISSAALGNRMLKEIDTAFEKPAVDVYPSVGRRRFMAISGIVLSLISALGILAQAIPPFVIGACDG